MNATLIAAFATPIVVVLFYLIALSVIARNISIRFDSARVEMDKRVNEQIQRVDGLVRQYREIAKKMRVLDMLGADVAEMRDYVENELTERIGEIDLSVLAILEPDDEDEVESYPLYTEKPAPVVQIVQPKKDTSKVKTSQPTGFQAVEAVAKKPSVSYDRYQELRNQGYSAAEATAMMRGQSNGTVKKGKRNG